MAFFVLLVLLVITFVALGASDGRAARWLRIVVGIAMAGAVLIVGSIVLAVVLAFGVHKDAPDLDFDDRSMAAARLDAERAMDARFAGFEARAPQLRQVADGRTDGCNAGSYNWKIKDAHAWDCSVTDVRVYAFSGDFAIQATAIARSLPEQRCAPGERTDAEEALAAGGSTPVVDALAGGTGSCGGYGTSADPGLVVEGWIVLPLVPEHGRTNGGKVPAACRSYEQDSCRNDPIDLAAAAAAAPEGTTHLVVVATSARSYWQADWR